MSLDSLVNVHGSMQPASKTAVRGRGAGASVLGELTLNQLLAHTGSHRPPLKFLVTQLHN